MAGHSERAQQRGHPLGSLALLTLVVLAFSLFDPVISEIKEPTYWSTRGSKIVDAEGKQVLISGVNWMGGDADIMTPHGLWVAANSYTGHLDEMKRLGFNLIRLGFSGQMFKDPRQMPKHIDYSLNPTLRNLTAVEVFDKIVEGAREREIRIILDYHRVNAGHLPEAGLWYDAESSEDYWVKTWTFLAARYANNPTVVGVDLFNEIHEGPHPGPFWAKEGEAPGFNWRDAVIKAANAIQEVNPGVLICVQGMPKEGWWGANLQPYRDLPVQLKVPNKLVYSVHDYGPSVGPQPQWWLTVSDFPNNLPQFWSTQWAFMVDEGIAPVWIGEWGSALRVDGPHWAAEEKWVHTLRDFISSKKLSWTWFMWTPNSHDTEGILKDDYKTPDKRKLDILAPIMYPNFGPQAPPPASTPTEALPPQPPPLTFPDKPETPPATPAIPEVAPPPANAIYLGPNCTADNSDPKCQEYYYIAPSSKVRLPLNMSDSNFGRPQKSQNRFTIACSVLLTVITTSSLLC